MSYNYIYFKQNSLFIHLSFLSEPKFPALLMTQNMHMVVVNPAEHRYEFIRSALWISPLSSILNQTF